VVVLGMPYPNPADPELRERMRYLAAQQPAPASDGASAALHGAASPCSDGLQQALLPQGSQAGRGGQAGREYYEDLCMKAVNQCIGRVIRHAADWAAVVLVDARWGARARAGGGPGLGDGADGRGWDGPLGKLPAWIQTSLVVAPNFGDAYARLHRFTRAMRAT
jgi:chromosome transmission fidelity protein 1